MALQLGSGGRYPGQFNLLAQLWGRDMNLRGTHSAIAVRQGLQLRQPYSRIDLGHRHILADAAGIHGSRRRFWPSG